MNDITKQAEWRKNNFEREYKLYFRDPEQKQRFKQYCLEQGYTMTGKLRNMVDEVLAESTHQIAACGVSRRP